MNTKKMPAPWFRGSHSARTIMSFGSKYAIERSLAEGERSLGSFILPPFQRPPAWTREQQVRLIESLWAGLPIGAYVYNQLPMGDGQTDGWLLDGQQRITAILAYMADEFRVHGCRFSDLAPAEQQDFKLKPVSAIETAMRDPAQCKEVYDRLAYGGTPHTNS